MSARGCVTWPRASTLRAHGASGTLSSEGRSDRAGGMSDMWEEVSRRRDFSSSKAAPNSEIWGPPRWQRLRHFARNRQKYFVCFSHCGRAETRPNDQDSPQVPLDGAVGAVTSTSSQGQRQARAAWVSPGPHTIMPWRRDTRWLLGRTLPTLSPRRVWNTRVVGLVFTALRLVTC